MDRVSEEPPCAHFSLFPQSFLSFLLWQIYSAPFMALLWWEFVCAFLWEGAPSCVKVALFLFFSWVGEVSAGSELIRNRSRSFLSSFRRRCCFRTSPIRLHLRLIWQHNDPQARTINKLDFSSLNCWSILSFAQWLWPLLMRGGVGPPPHPSPATDGLCDLQANDAEKSLLMWNKWRGQLWLDCCLCDHITAHYTRNWPETNI